LLDISRLDAGALIPDPSDFALGQLFDSLRVEFAPLAERKRLDLRIVPTSLAVTSDRQLLQRVLQNLLSNAVRYTRNGKVLMGVRRNGAEVIIQISDTGIGIPLEHHDRVFQEFQHFEPGTWSDHGLGLGLSIVDRISRMLDHPVRFHSRPGQGTTFTVQVPRGKAIEACSPIELMPPRALPSLEQAVVLCVDNETAVLDGMRVLLGSWSCRVLLARSIGEALALASTEPVKPELLIIDYHLDQSGDGEDCVDALQRAYGAALPTVIVTADRSEAVRSRALALGHMVLHKPVRPAALRSLLMRLLATREAAE
jgi:CheY-like chemotaxis protein/anti-sigma regulatory factor (Ser/Thr protein kinase)